MILLFAVLVLTSQKRGLLQQAQDYLSNYGEVAQWEITSTVETGRNQILSLAASPYISEGLHSRLTNEIRAAERQYLLDNLSINNNFVELFIIDPEGIVQVSTDPSQEQTNNTNRTYFSQGQDSLYIQTVYHHLSLQHPVMTIAAPIHAADGRLLGVLAGHLDVNRWDDYLSPSQGLGKTGEVYLINSYNYFVTSPGGLPGYAFERANFSEGVSDCLEGNSRTIQTTNYAGQDVLGSYLWLENLDLCLVTEMETVEALEPISFLIRQVFYVLMLVAVAGGYAVLRSVKTVTQPIETLTEGAVRLGRGELDVRVPVQGRNEISILAENFNQMADRLTATIASLSESEAKYRGIFENVQDIFYQTDGQGNIIEISPSSERYIDLPRSSLIGRKVADFYYDVADYHALLAAMEPSGRVEDFEVRIKTGHDEIMWVSVNALYVFDDAGDLIRSEGVLRDISERKRIALLLKENQERLELAVRGTGAGLWDWNVQTGEVVFNERWAEIIGYSLDELQPITIQTWLEHTHPQDLIRSNQLLEKHFAGDLEHYVCEARMKHRNGEWVWILDRGMVTERDAEGRPLRMTGTHVDINEQIKAQQARQESEARFRGLFESTADGIAIINMDGVIQQINPAFCTITGYKPVDQLNQPIQLLSSMVTDSGKLPSSLQTAKDRVAQTGMFRAEVESQRPDGTLYDVDVAVTASHYSTHSEPDLVVSIRDITRMKALDRMKGRVISTVSHELRTPLSIIILYVENLLEFYDRMEEDQRISLLRDVQEEAGSLQQLIEDVLLLSRLDENRIQTQHSPFNLAELARETTSELLSTAARKNVSIDLDLASDPTVVLGSRDQFRQVLRNLLTNAIKFSNNSRTVQVRLHSEGPTCTLEVQDEGIGILPEEIDKVFERFYRGQTAEQKEIPGTGLGLAIVKEIVTKHSGTIKVSSTPQKGSTFQVIVPLYETNEHKQEAQSTHE